MTKTFSDLFILVQKIDRKLNEEWREARNRDCLQKISEIVRQLAAAESWEADAISKREDLSQSLVQPQKQSVHTK